MTKEERQKYLQTIVNTKLNTASNSRKSDCNLSEIEAVQKKCKYDI